MRMVMISYNSAIDSEVIEALRKCSVESYTKWTKVHGRGKTSGTHFGSEIWPGENTVVFTAIDDKKAGDLLNYIKGLRIKLGKSGIKAFAWQLEDIT